MLHVSCKSRGGLIIPAGEWNTYADRIKIARVIREQRHVSWFTVLEGPSSRPLHLRHAAAACFLAGLRRLGHTRRTWTRSGPIACVITKPYRPFKIVYATLYLRRLRRRLS